jgi:lipopolysaccharide/colanic/teichoic acid biosynthesis glycosyltransferase
MNQAKQVQISPIIESIPGGILRSQYLVIRHWLACLFIVMSLPILLPLGLLVSLSIKLDSRGGVIFAQPRVGLYGRIFTMYKFRTMIIDSHTPFTLTEEDDTRITRVGKILRATHLDELPQVWNILRGEMDLIGPRPVPFQLYAFYQEAIPNYDMRHVLRPGVTGLAQIQLGHTTTLDGEMRKWAYDMEYLTKVEILTDTRILVRTLWLLVKHRKMSVPNNESQNRQTRKIVRHTTM